MNAVFKRIRSLMATPRLKWIAAPALLAAVVSSVIGVGTLPPTVNLAAEPLYARGARAKPTLTLVLSVEFPTVGAQFLGSGGNDDDTYLPTNEYIGYFDAESCYTYNDMPTEARPLGVSEADYKRFDRTSDAARNAAGASLHTCNTTASNAGFSGNFMNWVSSSAIDILRRGLSGGDRIVDTSIVNAGGFTVLQRAVLPTSFWNTNNFPSKRLKASLAAGAVPPVLLTTTAGTAWASDVYVANCLNRIHFGTEKTGNCNAPGNNANLGVKVQAIPANGSYSGPLPIGTIQMATENGTFTIATGATKQVFYGANTSWAVKTYTAGTSGLTVSCNNATFGDPLVGTAKACYSRDRLPPSASPGVTADGFMYSRVRVCESSATGLIDPRKDLCLQYPNGSYKPVGNLQKYSDRVRVAAFGYLNDSSNSPQRYGGVLREPMKYVGAKRYDDNFSLMSGANPYQEWSEQTGELIANPDLLTTEVRSGLINYLNQFGRTGPSPGVYKTYDPVGELYYEALRYLQGLPPTEAATTGMTDAMKDGFPVYTTWADPHPPVSGMTSYSCVKNNIVGIGDVNTWNDKTIPGNDRTNNDSARSANLAANMPNFKDWTNVIGQFESRGTVSYLDGLGRTQTTAGIVNPNSSYPNLASMATRDIGASGAAYYISGMAYWANTHDIRGPNWTDTVTNPGLGNPLLDKQRPGMRVTTYFLDVNEFGGQTNATTHQQNQFFLAAKYGGFTDLTNTGNPFVKVGENSTATNPTTQPGNTYWEAPPSGSGETNNYFLSSSAKAVLTALDSIFASVAKQANSIAGAAVSSQQITSTASYVYQSQFDASDWSGDVTATPVSASNSGGVVSVGLSANAPWSSAATVLASKVAAGGTASRKIYVGGGSSTNAASEFLWASAPTYVKLALQTPINGTAPTDTVAVGQARLDYLRGDQTNESAPGTFRKRSKLLGDIVNSGVVYSGPPSSATAASTYGTFYNDNLTRKNMLFVGANDGMLHAFNADTGDEVFGYIPSWVVPKLSALTSPAYPHLSYVDATPAVGDAKVNGIWKTVLVSGSGGGGQGVFALDVTKPDSATFDASKVLWEFSELDDVDLGNVVSRPQILALKTNASGTSKYFAVVASGVNNYAVDGHANTTGSSALFFLDLSKPSGTAWSLNSNYFKIVFPGGTALSTTIANGMSSFKPLNDSNGLVSAIYAGDLQGNMWKLDFKKATNGTTDWTMEKLSGFVDTSAKPVPFYIAMDGAETPSRQPITMDPTLVYGPNGSILVSFGTGKFLEVSDISGSYKVQSVYSLMDNGSAVRDVSTSAIAGRGRLQQGTASSGTITVPVFSFGRPTADNLAPTPTTAPPVRAGWYFDFPGSASSGERQVSNFAVLGNLLVFGSVIPSLNSCGDGSGNLYLVDALGGNGTSQVSTVGIIGPPLVLTVADSSLSNNPPLDSTGQGTQVTRYAVGVSGSSGIGFPGGTLIPKTVGRLSWREINNR